MDPRAGLGDHAETSSLDQSTALALPYHRAMELPRVNPIGILEGGAASPRRPSPLLRALAVVVLLVFVAVTVLTTVLSVGSYCLTTEPGDVRPLPSQAP
jgi:hypothetical protein